MDKRLITCYQRFSDRITLLNRSIKRKGFEFHFSLVVALALFREIFPIATLR